MQTQATPGPQDAPTKLLLEALTDPDISAAIYRWANEKNVGRIEWLRRSDTITKMEDAIAKVRGEAQ